MGRYRKDPDRPKRHKNKSRNLGNIETVMKGASLWKTLSAREKFPYEQRAAKLKVQYERDFKRYQARIKSLPPSKRPQLKKSRRDPNRPKKALSAYMLFMQEFRKKNGHRGWDVKRMVSQGAAVWKTLNYRERAPYESMARRHASKYRKQITAYLRKQNSQLRKDKTKSSSQLKMAKRKTTSSKKTKQHSLKRSRAANRQTSKKPRTKSGHSKD